MKRAGSALLVLAVLAVGAFALLQLVVARDDAEVATPSGGVGQTGASECPRGKDLLTRDGIALSEDERDYLLSLGNVVLQGDVDALRPLQKRLTGGYDPEFALAGQSVYVEPGEAFRGLAWGRSIDAGGADDPALEDFASTYLGQGAGDECG